MVGLLNSFSQVGSADLGDLIRADPYATPAALPTPDVSNNGQVAVVGASASTYVLYYSDGSSWTALTGEALNAWSGRDVDAYDGHVGCLVPMKHDGTSGIWHRTDPFGDGTPLAAFDSVAQFKGSGTAEPVDQGWTEYGNTNAITASGGIVTMDLTGIAADPGSFANAVRIGSPATAAAYVCWRIDGLQGTANGSSTFAQGFDIFVEPTKLVRFWVPQSASTGTTWRVGVTGPLDTGIAATAGPFDVEVWWRNSDDKVVVWRDGNPLPSVVGTATNTTQSSPTFHANAWQYLTSGSSTAQLKYKRILMGMIEA